MTLTLNKNDLDMVNRKKKLAVHRKKLCFYIILSAMFFNIDIQNEKKRNLIKSKKRNGCTCRRKYI